MSNLLASLMTSSNALRSFTRVLDVVQNNVSNASTPGYARQSLSLRALAAEPQSGLPGGVTAGEVESARNQYAENNVQRQLHALGFEDQKTNSLAEIDSIFDVSGESGVPGALNRLFQSFSAWSAAPNDAGARQAVLDRATDAAGAFRQTAADLSRASAGIDRQIDSAVISINGIAAKIREYNQAIRNGNAGDSGLDARMHAALDELAQYVNFTATRADDGSMTVLVGGQTPLVIGEQLCKISNNEYIPAGAVYPGGRPVARVTDSLGRDVTSQIVSGSLGALLHLRNGTVAGILGDATQVGTLNQLAQAITERVNRLLAGGQTPAGTPGAALFYTDPDNPSIAAGSMRSDPNTILAAIDPGPPAANGICLKLAGLANSTDPADLVNNLSYTAYYGEIAAGVGRELAGARGDRDGAEELVAQARSLREQLSGVSFDEEAAVMLQFQRSYEAVSRVITIINDLTEETINLIR